MEIDLKTLARHYMKIPGIIKMASRHSVLLLLTLCAFGFPFAIHTFGGSQEAADTHADYAAAREGILKFEDAINAVINSSFSENPFAVVQKAKGVYLQGYGVSFTFLVNIHRAVIKTPFGQVRTRRAYSSEVKAKRIEELKEKLVQVLQNSGDIFPQLRKDERIAIIAFVEDRNIPGETNENKTIIMSTLKKDLDELGQRPDRLKEFKQRMKIVEY
ncbi:MAG: hypothetical protein JXA73_24905 [Acidobacteria bacterium]|nr:hypothetical protein [Acidobacteriota bacterium]